MTVGEDPLSLSSEESLAYSPDVVMESNGGQVCSCGKMIVWNGSIEAQKESDADLVLRFLPDSFVDWYARLIDRGLRTEQSMRTDSRAGLLPGTGKVSNDKKWPVKSGQSNGIPSRGAGGVGRTESPSPIISESALAKRRLVDKQLRRIARELQAWHQGDTVIRSRKCIGRCKRIGEADWLFCPNCGGPMGER